MFILLHYELIKTINKQAWLAFSRNNRKIFWEACPQMPLEGKALRTLLPGALGAGIVTVQIPPRAGVKVEM